MDRALANYKRSFLDGLRASRMGMAGSGQIFRRAANLAKAMTAPASASRTPPQVRTP